MWLDELFQGNNLITTTKSRNRALLATKKPLCPSPISSLTFIKITSSWAFVVLSSKYASLNTKFGIFQSTIIQGLSLHPFLCLTIDFLKNPGLSYLQNFPDWVWLPRTHGAVQHVPLFSAFLAIDSWIQTFNQIQVQSLLRLQELCNVQLSLFISQQTLRYNAHICSFIGGCTMVIF